jgi:TPR repeat protein
LIRSFLIIVMFLFLPTALVWADNQATYVDSLKKEAAQGDVEAQLSLGSRYLRGRGVPQDYAEALKWFRLAADQGNADAQSSLGAMYYEGKGTPPNYAGALKWFRLAADQGNAGAQHNLGFMYSKGEGIPQDYVQAHKWFNLAAAAFSTNPQHDDSAKARDSIAAHMTPAQIAEAQKLAREWKKQ